MWTPRAAHWVPEVIPTLALSDGSLLPCLGLGVYQMSDTKTCDRAVREALDCGYRHIDTAQSYQNEEVVGRAVRESGVARSDVFLTTKVMPWNFGFQKTRDAVSESLRKLGVDYIDLFLLHWPVREGTEEAWEVLRELRSEGVLRSIGVSNFSIQRLEEQFLPQVEELPVVNQFESHPAFSQAELVAWCRERRIIPIAHSPLAQGACLANPTVRKIADSHGKSPAQVAIRWQLQRGLAVIPKSTTPKRIRENAGVFDFTLSDQDMAGMNALDCGASIITWRPEPDWF